MSRADAPKKPDANPLRKYAPLLAVVGVAALIMAGAYIEQSGLGIFRHDDPSQSKDGLPSALDLALMYSSIADHISDEEFAKASLLVGKLEGANIPDSVKYTFSRFNSLLLSQISQLNLTDAEISEALKHAKVGDTTGAQVDIDSVTWTLARANLTWSDLADAADEISEQFKMRALAPELEQIMQLIMRYASEAGDVMGEIGEIEAGNVTRTAITLDLGTNELIAGEGTWASGTLQSANGTPLPGMPVTVYAGGHAIGATTGADGSYNVTVTAAGFEEGMTVAAALLPQQGYAGCISSEETVLVNFIRPSIIVAADKGLILPQQSFSAVVHIDLSEWVHSNFSAPLPEAGVALVSILAFGQSISVLVTDGGDAQASFSVPFGAAEGPSQIVASVYPDRFIGPASNATSITVFRYTPTVSIEAPGYAMGGLPFTVTGIIWADDTYLANARVSMTVLFAGGETQLLEGMTDESGRFSISVPTSAFMQSGTARIDADIYPAEDSYADGYGGAHSYVLSPLAIAVPILALAALGGGAAMWRARAGRGSQGGNLPLSDSAVAVAVAAAPGIRQLPPEGTIAGAYARAASWVGSILGMRIRRSDTAREYYSKVEAGLGGAKEPFREMTSMLEEELYGQNEGSVPAAKGLFARIKAALGIAPSKGAGARERGR